MNTELNPALVRSHFPALDKEWIYLDNAGGTQTARQVGERLSEYLFSTNVQLGATYEISELAGRRVKQAQVSMAAWVNAPDPCEVVLGPSTTQLLQNLAKSMVQLFKAGDEVIVTDCDHEANIGPWMNMARAGIVVKTWKMREETLRLHLDDLEPLMTGKTRLVAFTHVSNILGTINPVREIADFMHSRGALVCVDGVAAVPHRLPDMQALDADFYVFSLYKVFGPHYSLLYGKKEHLEKLPGIGHYFIGNEEIPYKLQPGNVNFELTWSLMGILDYFMAVSDGQGMTSGSPRARSEFVYDLISIHEEKICRRLISFLAGKKGIRIIGESSADRDLRVPTVSFISDRLMSDAVVLRADPRRIGIRYGDFYARRLIERLGLVPRNGVVRVSMVHYNTMEEIEKLIMLMDTVL